MPNARLSELLANKLANGITHAGGDGREPMEIKLPAFARSDSLPPEYNDQIDLTVKLLSEAIVDTIESAEGRCIIVDRDAFLQMKATLESFDESNRTIMVHCSCNAEQPIASMRIGSGGKAMVNGEQFIRSLTRRTPACPHSIIEES